MGFTWLPYKNMPVVQAKAARSQREYHHHRSRGWGVNHHTERHCELQRRAALLDMCLKPCGRRLIFQPGWTGHGRCALLWSMPGSANNVPSSPSLQSMASSGGLVTASIARIKRARCLLGVLPTSTVDHWSRQGTGIFHFPQGSRQEQRHRPPHCIAVAGGTRCAGDGWALPCSHASGQEQPSTATAAEICCLKGTVFLLAAVPLGKEAALRGSSLVITRGNSVLGRFI